MIAAFYNTGRRNQRDFSVFLQLFNGQATAVTHGMLHFAQGQIDIVFQAASIGDVGVDTFLKGKLFVAAQIVALPVARARSLRPSILSCTCR